MAEAAELTLKLLKLGLTNRNDAISEARCRTVGGVVYHFMHGKVAGPEARGPVPQG